MPDSGDDAVRARHSPLRRVISLMRTLTEAHDESGGYRVFTDQELMNEVKEYGHHTVEPKRTLRNDKAALRARGLIVTGRRHPREAHKRGTSRASYLDKKRHLWLSVEEHETLRRARQARITRSKSSGKPSSGFPVGPTSPPTDRDERGNTTVDDALRLLRLLEEYGGEVSVEVVADCFGIGERRARNWLAQMVEGLNDEYSSPLEELWVDDDGEDDSRGPVVRAVVLRVDEASKYPFAETGTALLGLFPYSRPEVEERLDLIAEYRNNHMPDSETAALLDSIEWKLATWAEQLPKHGQG